MPRKDMCLGDHEFYINEYLVLCHSHGAKTNKMGFVMRGIGIILSTHNFPPSPPKIKGKNN